VQEYSRRLSWLQGFGLHLWFGESPQNVSIVHAIEQYQNGVKREEAPRPVPARRPRLRTVWHRREDQDYLEDVRFGLLKYYCNAVKSVHKPEGSSSVSGILRPESWVSDPLDYSLTWHLHDALQFTSTYSLDEFPRLDSLYLSFMWQLEAMGEWDWAIYVALHTPSANNTWVANHELARDILMRHVTLSPDPRIRDVALSQDCFETCLDRPSEGRGALVSANKMPQHEPHLALCQSTWWHEAQAIRARYERVPSLEFSHLMSCVETDPDHPQALEWLEQAYRVAVIELRPLYQLTLDPHQDLAELENRLRPFRHLLKDGVVQRFLAEPEPELPPTQPKGTGSRNFCRLVYDRPMPLSQEVLASLLAFESAHEF